jgi:hypothetical protein
MLGTAYLVGETISWQTAIAPQRDTSIGHALLSGAATLAAAIAELGGNRSTARVSEDHQQPPRAKLIRKEDTVSQCGFETSQEQYTYFPVAR